MADPSRPAPAAPPLSAAAAYARGALAPATSRTYASHLRAWEAWCRGRGPDAR